MYTIYPYYQGKLKYSLLSLSWTSAEEQTGMLLTYLFLLFIVSSYFPVFP